MSANTNETPRPAGPPPKSPATWKVRLDRATDRFLRPEWLADAEQSRRGRLITQFGLMGFGFGLAYAAFYLLIGHHWGTGIIVVCSAAFALLVWTMKFIRSIEAAGILLSAIMVAGFTALCAVEGGIHGHAVAWLASVPLCTLLLAGKQAAQKLVTLCLGACGVVIAVELAGIKLPTTYPEQWHSSVTAAGYLGLIGFMFLLGLIFENSRARAFQKMQQALDDLRASNEQLVVLNQEKSEFLGIAAHDLRNPLTTIIGSAEMLTLTEDPGQTARLAGYIQTAGTQMCDLINNLLDSHAIEEGRFISKLEPCDLAALAAQSVERNRPNATRKQITLRLEAPETTWALTDRSAALQILDNLISNAVKYSPAQTTVQIRVSTAGGRAFAAVQDQGPGLSAEDQRKLFGKFVRLSARPTGGESSNGLGLSIVKRLAEALAGSVECHSRLGEGATFVVKLPAGQPATN